MEFLYGDASCPNSYPLTRAAIRLLENSDYKGCDAILLAYTESVIFGASSEVKTGATPVMSVSVPYMLFDLKQKRITYAHRSNTEVIRESESVPTPYPDKRILWRFTESEETHYIRTAQQIISSFPPAP